MRRTMCWLVTLASLALPGAALAQDSSDPRRGHATRDDLERLLNRLQASAQSPGYSGRLRAEASQQAAVIRARLERGDFHVGDRVLLVVEHEEVLTDTFTVREGPELVLPTIGTVPLRGVLRAELQDHLQEYVARYVRDPVVRTRTVIRLAFTGALARPGFYTVPSETPITDALMAAGGPTPNAQLDEIRIERGTRTLWEEEPMRRALAEGRTIDQLNLQGGDRVLVKERGGLLALDRPLRVVTLLITLPAAIFGLTRIF